MYFGYSLEETMLLKFCSTYSALEITEVEIITFSSNVNSWKQASVLLWTLLGAIKHDEVNIDGFQTIPDLKSGCSIVIYTKDHIHSEIGKF